ncbi:spore germination protein KB [Paenibacillus sp. UNCCL117]|uniref:GerAB/ArcD/ProY family transporter n=1 Tax=unclassified Paenibacillus TaxID=185978 RepID=UPI00088C1E39|nr:MULTISPECIES: endospore germination permease [unclassified Paenibacillus]SDD42193.1 spore germination protein KB [Paenibacillus sp. cl123]SFW47663.1 spore germination protein KB [Paenibacillus sp. UNCCL117]
MKHNEVVSSGQVASLFLAFMTGSSIINIPGTVVGLARQGAWISLLLSSACGGLLLAFVLFLHRRHPARTWIEMSRESLGAVVTFIVCLPFLVYLFLMMTWIIIDIGGFFTLTMMPETPVYIFNLPIIIISALTVRAGIEVMCRMFKLLLYIMIFFAVAVLIMSLPNYHPEYLLPIIHTGWKPILHGAYYTFGFPYAEVVIFSMLLVYRRRGDKSRLGLHMARAYLINVLLLMTAIVCTIMAFGPVAVDLKYSLFQIARLISIGDFIERVESVIGISLILGSYMKATIALFVLNLALSQIARLRNGRILIMVIAMASFALTLIMFKHQADFAEKVSEVWPLINLFGGIAPLFLLVGAVYVKRMITK